MNQGLQRISQGNAVALRDNDPMAEWQVIREQASVLIASGFLPASVKSPEAAMAIILTGRELGIGPMAALNNINIIQGKPTLSPQLMLAMANGTNQVEDIKIEADGNGATVVVKRRGRSPYTTAFGPKEAKAMGLDGKDNYKKQPATMYQWRAVAANLRITFPDVIMGMYTPDEMGATVTGDGDVVEGFNAPPLSTDPTASGIDIQGADVVQMTYRVETFNALHQLFIDSGKSEDDWLTYSAKERFDDLPTEKLKLKLNAWQKAAIDRERTMTQVESLLAQLTVANVEKAEQDAVIAKTTGGKSLDECDTKTLKTLIETLNAVIAEVEVKA